MRLGDGVVMIGGEWSQSHKSPRSAGGITTQTVHVHVDEDIDAHCARARAAGATILAEPADQFYGDRTYRARDLEGHIWSFAQTVREVSREEAEQASGLKIEGWV
ncbi:MAG: VOC family protein [Xanthobacteraceae bacterium]